MNVVCMLLQACEIEVYRADAGNMGEGHRYKLDGHPIYMLADTHSKAGYH